MAGSRSWCMRRRSRARVGGGGWRSGDDCGWRPTFGQVTLKESAVEVWAAAWSPKHYLVTAEVGMREEESSEYQRPAYMRTRRREEVGEVP